ncbi:unnamed protein product [Brassica oleracea]
MLLYCLKGFQLQHMKSSVQFRGWMSIRIYQMAIIKVK